MSRHQRTRKNHRTGAAIVEFAVCLPVVLLLAFGSIEAASMLFLRQALVQASYEGCKVAARGGTQSDVEAAVRAVAMGRRIVSLDINTSPKSIQSLEPGEPFTITVRAPGDANSLIPFGPFRKAQVAAQASMIRE